MDESQQDSQIELIADLVFTACVFGSSHGEFIGDQVDLDRMDAMLRSEVEAGERTANMAWFHYLVYEEYNTTPESQRKALC